MVMSFWQILAHSTLTETHIYTHGEYEFESFSMSNDVFCCAVKGFCFAASEIQSNSISHFEYVTDVPFASFAHPKSMRHVSVKLERLS